MVIELTREEAYAVADFIDANLMDTDIDSMEWLKNMIHACEKMCKGSGYIGLTEHKEEVTE